MPVVLSERSEFGDRRGVFRSDGSPQGGDDRVRWDLLVPQQQTTSPAVASPAASPLRAKVGAGRTTLDPCSAL